ncbi:hypothetical protein K438DRAFT_779652 [Mycena galopus ATCC 62051]|nr:hypothetical protein K438DRAFT_779652 [Mycena galopus ATCC 62051]
MLLPRVLSLALFTLLAASQDDGQSQDNVLNNGRGETPCQMKTTFLESTCTNQPERNPNDDTTPTACTCTNVYFNLWSACAYTTTPANPPYPSCDTFQQNCSQAALNITTFPQSANTSQSYPDWAFFELPANGTFDIVAAIASTDSSKSHKWTIIQIVLPILVGVGVAVVSFLIYRWRKKNANRPRDWMKTTGGRPRFQFPSFSSRQMVRELNRSSSWSIDDREEDLGEYQFVSYPASLQGSQASGHVRLSPSSSRVPGPPPLKIPEKKPPVQTWPGKSIWKSPLQSVRQLSTSIPRPWRTRIGVKNVPGYPKFRVDAADSDSPLSQRPGAESLLGHPRRSRSNLQHETVFEQENEDDSDSDEEALPFIPQEHSRSNHDAEPPSNSALLISSNAGADSPNSSQRTLRQIPPRASPPRIPLPLLPPVPTLPPPPSASTSQQTVRPQEPPPRLAPPPPPQSVGRSQVSDK